MLQIGGTPLKLEYTDKKLASRARSTVLHGNAFNVPTPKLFYGIEVALKQAYMLGHEVGETEVLSK
jgi:hypothetical protein